VKGTARSGRPLRSVGLMLSCGLLQALSLRGGHAISLGRVAVRHVATLRWGLAQTTLTRRCTYVVAVWCSERGASARRGGSAAPTRSVPSTSLVISRAARALLHDAEEKKRPHGAPLARPRHGSSAYAARRCSMSVRMRCSCRCMVR
jgi:hypothetical protein